jgi:hypothetical protein
MGAPVLINGIRYKLLTNTSHGDSHARTTSAGDTAPPITEDQAIRQRVKGLTSQVLQQGRVDPEAIRDVVRVMIGRTPGNSGR